jgi:hypothetical protein
MNKAMAALGVTVSFGGNFYPRNFPRKRSVAYHLLASYADNLDSPNSQSYSGNGEADLGIHQL